MVRVESKWFWTMMQRWQEVHPKPTFSCPKPPEWKVEEYQNYEYAKLDYQADLQIWFTQLEMAESTYRDVEENDRAYKVYDKVAQSLIYAKLEVGEYEVDETQKLWNQLKELQKRKSSEEACSEYYLITLTPGMGVDIERFKQLVERFVNRKFVRGYVYAFEQSGEVEEAMGKNPHVHIIVRQKKHYGRSKIKQYVDETFHSLYKPEGLKGNSIKPQFADVKCLKSTTVNTQVEKYLEGDKKDDSKHAAVELNGKWRTLYGIDQSYKGGDLVYVDGDEDEEEEEA